MKTMMATLALLAVMAAPLAAQGGTSGVDERKQEIINKLNNQRLDVDFEDARLEDALSFLRDFSGLNLHVDAGVHELLSEEELKVTLKVKNLLLKSILKLMLGQRGLSAMYQDGVVLIVPKSKIDEAVKLAMYDVRDMLFKIRDFPGPTVELVSPNAAGGPLTGATFTLDEPRSTITEDFLTDIIMNNTGDRTWDENPNASITLTNGVLVVSQSKRVHSEIRKLLNQLRQYQ